MTKHTHNRKMPIFSTINGKTEGELAFKNSNFEHHVYHEEHLDKEITMNNGITDTNSMFTPANKAQDKFSDIVRQQAYLEGWFDSKETNQIDEPKGISMEEYKASEAIRFGRWLLKYCRPTLDDDMMLIWEFKSEEYNTDKLYQEFINQTQYN